jgi:hypothetical protein
MKKVHILHNITENDRETTKEFALSFGKYAQNYEVFYTNMTAALDFKQIPNADIAILTYELMSIRNTPYWGEMEQRIIKIVNKSSEVIVFVQDDYAGSKFTEKFISKIKSKATLYSPVARDLDKMYPGLIDSAEIKFCLTGYVDDEKIELSKQNKQPFADREIIFGNRVRKLPMWLGEQALKKSEISLRAATIFSEKGMRVDESSNPHDTKMGIEWLKFLGKTKYTAGSMGGSSLTDPSLELQRRCKRAIDQGQVLNASTLERFISNKNLRGDFATIGPRLFEAAMMGTCQILLDDQYLEGLVPDVHYLSCNKDLSNLNEIINKIEKDVSLGDQIAKEAYDYLIESGKFSYRSFVQKVLPNNETNIEDVRNYKTISYSERENELYRSVRSLNLSQLIIPGSSSRRLFHCKEVKNATFLGINSKTLQVRADQAESFPIELR